MDEKPVTVTSPIKSSEATDHGGKVTTEQATVIECSQLALVSGVTEINLLGTNGKFTRMTHRPPRRLSENT